MSEWIVIEMDLPDHAKVRRIGRLVGIEADTVIGKLVRVWSWFDRNSVDGFVDACVSTDVDDLARQQGFARAMASVGWLILDSENERIGVPEFGSHHGNSAKKRHLNSARQARYRASKRQRSVDAPVDATPSTPVDGPARQKPRPHKQNKDKEEQEPRPTADAAGRVTAQSGDLLGGNGGEPPKKAPAPIQAIVDLYHQALPELPRVFKLTDKRRDQIKARWREDMTDLDDWTDYFDRVRKVPFLMGKKPPSPGRTKAFIADLEFLTRAGTFAKIIEGFYHG